MTEFRVMVFYLSLIIFPFPQRLNLDHNFIVSKGLFDPLGSILSLLMLVFLVVFAIRVAGRQRLLSFGILWFLGNLVIESTIVPLELVNEHRLYLPSTMLFFAVFETTSRYVRPVAIKLPIIVLLVFFLAFGTYQRNKVWVDRITLWSDCVLKSPLKARSHINLAVALKRAGHLTKAEFHGREAIRLDPSSAEAYNNLGNVMVLLGLFDEAIENYSKGVKLGPPQSQMAVLHLNLGEAFMKTWRLEEAEFHFRKAVAIQPGDRRARASYYRVREMIGSKRSKLGAKPENLREPVSLD
jgi:hypothetical protein